jgi:hypothetical protein
MNRDAFALESGLHQSADGRKNVAQPCLKMLFQQTVLRASPHASPICMPVQRILFKLFIYWWTRRDFELTTSTSGGQRSWRPVAIRLYQAPAVLRELRK